MNRWLHRYAIAAAVTSLSWTLLHMLLLLRHGTVTIGESNPYLLGAEIGCVAVGLCCYVVREVTR